jgi:hypothetical protein
MFLKINDRFTRRMRQDDSGSALVAVIGVLLVTIVIASVVSASAVHALGYTSATRAGTQSQAAADAGIAAGKAVLMTSGACTTSMTELNSTDPHYRVTIWRGTATGTWTLGCPTSTSTQARLISTGYATSKGTAGQDGGDLSYEELILNKEVIQSSGAAIFLGAGGQFNQFTLSSGNSETADIRVKTGNWECSSAGTYDGNIIVENGSATLSNAGCQVNGSIHAKTSVTISAGGKVTGDIIASGGNVNINASAASVNNVYVNGDLNFYSGTIKGSAEVTGSTATFNSGAVVMGSLWTKTLNSLAGRINSNLIVSSTSGTSTITPGSASDKRVGGTVTLGGGLNSWADSGSCTQHWNEAGYACALVAQGAVGGPISLRVTGLAAPTAKPAPSVPPWVDVSYVWADWQAVGYAQQKLDWPSTLCNIDNNGVNTAYFQSVLNQTVSTVYDTRTGCPGGVYFGLSAHVNMSLKTNLTFVGAGFRLEGMTVNSNNTIDRQINFIVPDGNMAAAGPNCSYNNGQKGVIHFNNTTKLGDHAYGMLYTPCAFEINNGSKWRGQIYAGKITTSAADGLTYLPIGIAGVNLDGAAMDPSISPFKVTSSRNRSDNGGA